jgi:hypothetical protein
MEKINRRRMAAMVGGLAGAGALTSLFGASTDTAAEMKKTPWPYKPLDADKAAQRAYEAFLKGHCMYGGFEPIAGAVAEQLGSPYTDFPFAMFRYGAGGVNGWGTLCGAVNGCAAAIQLLSPDPGPLIDTLMAWYQTEPLPNFHPKGARFPEVRSAAGTPLCHESIAHWTKASGKSAFSPERMERCGALTASVVRKTVQLLNDQLAGKPVAGYTPSQRSQGCMSCHGQGGAIEVRSRMECGDCHSKKVKPEHPKE